MLRLHMSIQSGVRQIRLRAERAFEISTMQIILGPSLRPLLFILSIRPHHNLRFILRVIRPLPFPQVHRIVPLVKLHLNWSYQLSLYLLLLFLLDLNIQQSLLLLFLSLTLLLPFSLSFFSAFRLGELFLLLRGAFLRFFLRGFCFFI